MAKATDLVQGTLDLLILKTLSLEPKHGWAIAKRIQQVSQEALQIQQGSLYPALHRLEQQGWIQSERRPTERLARRRHRLFLLAIRVRPGSRDYQPHRALGWTYLSHHRRHRTRVLRRRNRPSFRGRHPNLLRPYVLAARQEPRLLA